MGYEGPAGVINFKPGTPDLRHFPVRLWFRMLKESTLGLPRISLPMACRRGDPSCVRRSATTW